MPRVTIQQFRAALAGGHGTLARAYRELTCRPELATGMRRRDWIPWTGVAAPTASA